MDAEGPGDAGERFWVEMDAVIPWARLLGLIAPHYPQAGRGRQPLGLEKMLRIYFLQQWFNLSDPQAEDALYDSESMRRVARIELGDDVIPDETTILRFRHLLEKHRLTATMFEAITGLLTERRLLLKAGTIVDATVIAAPSSTKNAAGAPALRHGEETVLYGDQAYWKEADRQGFEARGVRYRINRRPATPGGLSTRWRLINRARSRTRACGEHPYPRGEAPVGLH